MPEVKETAAPPELTILDLLSRAPIYNWHEWLVRMNAAKTASEVLGLLHCGFDVSMSSRYGEPEYDVSDRLAYYLRFANGWDNYGLLQTPEERSRVCSDSPEAKARQQFARKAFDVVCQRFFKESEKNSVSDREDTWWVKLILSEKVLAALQSFFRVEKKYPQPHMSEYDDVVVHNLPEKPFQRDFPHLEKLAVNFLLQLNEALWRWKESDLFWLSEKDKPAQKKHDAKVRALIDAARLWMIEVLCALPELNALREHMLELSDAHITKLTKIALRGRKFFEPGLPDGMKATTLEEALYLGSREALFLMERKAKVAVKSRLNSIREAKRAKEEAEQKLKKLEGRK